MTSTHELLGQEADARAKAEEELLLLRDRVGLLERENAALQERLTTIDWEHLEKTYTFQRGMVDKKSWLPEYDKGGLWMAGVIHVISGGSDRYSIKDAVEIGDFIEAEFKKRFGEYNV